MERDDVQLIRSTLSGDDAAFNTLVKKIPKRCTCPGMAQDWRFSLCRGNYARHLPPSLQKTPNTQEPGPVCWVALRYCKSTLPELAAQEKTYDTIFGGHFCGRNRKILL